MLQSNQVSQVTNRLSSRAACRQATLSIYLHRNREEHLWVHLHKTQEEGNRTYQRNSCFWHTRIK